MGLEIILPSGSLSELTRGIKACYGGIMISQM